jgi:hypothetical protein
MLETRCVIFYKVNKKINRYSLDFIYSYWILSITLSPSNPSLK